ncbi:MAG: hypothetical protein LBH05_00770 [Deferribacteraceae bacterium]|jgi:hypothetical protein|nr:hypothetical protein [Deferribacteraceae bacterium]
MITVITRNNAKIITNEGLRKDVEYYLNMYDRFIDEIAVSGMRIDDRDDSAARADLIEELKRLGVTVRNSAKSLVWGNISPSCLECRTGEGSVTYILSLKCNR